MGTNIHDRLLAKQYELAKIDETNDSGIVQVLDRAIEPDRKSKPKRTLIVILTAMIAGFVAIVWVFIKEANERARMNPEKAEQLNVLRRYIWTK